MRRYRGYSKRRSRGASTIARAGIALLKRRMSTRYAGVNKRPRLSTGTRFKAGRSRTTTNRRRRRSNELRSNNEDLQQSSRSVGRRMRFTNRFTRRFVSKNVETQIHSLSQISPYGGTTGPLLLPNWQPSPGTGPKRTPMTLMDLSSVTNVIDGIVQTPQTTWNITFSDETAGAIGTWIPAPVDWQLKPENISASASSFANKPHAQDYLKWAKIDMLFYHPLTISTKINVQLVQFMDRRLVPVQTVYPVSSENMDTFATAFWQSQLKGYMYSPISPTNGKSYSRYIKVLHNETFLLNPKESTEATNTRYKILKLFKNFNRCQKYDWEQNDAMNMDTGDIQYNLGKNQVTVQPKARIYLMIRALSTELTGGTYPPTGYANVWPTADIFVRTAHTSQC